MTGQESTAARPDQSCNVNSTFNFAVGAIAILTAIAIAYFIYRYWMR